SRSFAAGRGRRVAEDRGQRLPVREGSVGRLQVAEHAEQGVRHFAVFQEFHLWTGGNPVASLGTRASLPRGEHDQFLCDVTGWVATQISSFRVLSLLRIVPPGDSRSEPSAVPYAHAAGTARSIHHLVDGPEEQPP